MSNERDPTKQPDHLPLGDMERERSGGWTVLGIVDGEVMMCSTNVEHCRRCTESRGSVYQWMGRQWVKIGNGTGGN